MNDSAAADRVRLRHSVGGVYAGSHGRPRLDGWMYDGSAAAVEGLCEF